MTTTEVYDALHAAIRTEPDGVTTIDIWSAAAGSDALKDLIPVLELFGINTGETPSYTLTSVVLNQGIGTVALTGNGSFGQPGATADNTYSVAATLLYTEQGDIFSFSLLITDPVWTFSGFFLVLPDTLMHDPAGGVGIRWYPSFLRDMRVDSPAFSARTGPEEMLNLTGFLPEPADQNIADRLVLLSPWPLRLSGTVVMPQNAQDFPRMLLKASGNSSINAQNEPGVEGPEAINLTNLGLEIVVEELEPARVDRNSFSTLELCGDLALSGIAGRVSTLILSAGATWSFSIEFDKSTTSLVRGLSQLTKLFGVELPVPMNFPLLSGFYVAEVELGLMNNAASGEIPSFSLATFAVTITSDKVWDPPVPFVTFKDVGVRWVWGWTVVNDTSTDGFKKTYLLTGSVFGSITFGDGGPAGKISPAPVPALNGGSSGESHLPPAAAPATGKPVTIDVSLSIPDFYISGSMRSDDYIPIGVALEYYFGNSGPSTGLQTMNICRLRFNADPIDQNYSADTAIFFGDPENPDPQQGWIIDLYFITIILQELEFFVNVNNGIVSGGISGVFFLEQGDSDDYTLPRLVIRAEYPLQNPDIPEGWTLEGYLYPGTSIDLVKLVMTFLKLDASSTSAPSLTVDALDAGFTTGTKMYHLAGTISARWNPTIFDTELKISAAASIDIRKAAGEEAKPTGTLSGMFSINKIAVMASMDVGVAERTYLFKIQFGEIWLQAITSWRGNKENRHQAISVQLGGTTLGDILEYLVNLAAPTLGYSLDSPWDVLKRIELSSFVLTLDPTNNVVEFVFNANVNLAVMKIDTVGVRYTRGGAGKVDLILEGNFFGQDYSGENALAWDVINDPPPAVPGQGDALVDLRYLGIGQRIRIQDPPDTVSENIALLKQFMLPVTDPKNLPSTTGPVAFSADSQWLIGLDIGLMGGTVDLGLLFNDPILYGLSVALGGEKAGSLAGLRFEILYKKITNDIGMFRVELRIPDAFRTFQLGVASITLGIVVVEIYTNGNFMIDLGFPYDRNFDRSFSIQAYVFIGRGGFYLGVLNGDTSSNVPTITNGNFSPVLELGVGIAAGVGREIRAGILSGGAYVQIEVIFQGILAWFNPTSSGTAPAMYFRAQGVVAIHGKIYGCVDFKVIKVSVSLEAYAQVSAVFESYRPTVFNLEVSVSAEAEVQVLLVTVSFSFHVEFDIGFTLGSKEQTPWIVGGDQQGREVSGARALNSFMRRDRNRRTRALRDHHVRNTPLLASLAGAALVSDAGESWAWNPDKPLFPDGQARTAHFYFLPSFLIGDVPVTWTSPQPVPNPTPRYRASFVLCADSGVSANAKTAAATRLRSAALSPMAMHDADTDSLTSDLLVRVFLLYSLYSIPGGPAQEDDAVTSGQLALLINQLQDPEIADKGFALDMLEKVFSNNLHLAISGDPGEGAAPLGGMTLPLPPFLSWTSEQGGNIDFGTYNKVGPWYEWGISKILGQYFAVNADPGPCPAVDDPALYESFPAYLFRDYCFMIAKAAVNEARSLMENASVIVGEKTDNSIQSLSDVAKIFPNATVDYPVRSGDTVTSVAEALGATEYELEFLNPGLQERLNTAPVGSKIPVNLGIVPEALALDNSQEPFALKSLIMGTVPHQVAAQETLSEIAVLFNVTNITTFFEDADHVSTGLGSNSNLLQIDATFDYPAKSWTSSFSLIRVAAIFFTRYTLPQLSPSGWYAQAIFDLNRDALENLFPEENVLTGLEIPPGQTLTVPAAFNDLAKTTSYTTVPGDTLNRIGAALTLEQVYPGTSPDSAPEWQTFLSQVSSAEANTFSIPAWTSLFVLSGETVESLSRRLIADASWAGSDPNDFRIGSWTYNWQAIVQWLKDKKILSPLAVLPVPNAVVTAETLSFEILTNTYGVSISDAADRLKDVSGLYAENTTLIVTSLPVQTVKDLVDGVLSGEGMARVVNQGSRMLMAGLQLPALEKDPDNHMVPNPDRSLPLYDISGQQFDVPVDTDPDKFTDVALALSLSSGVSWITLLNSATVTEDDTHASLAEKHPGLGKHSPGLKAERPLAAGMVVLTSQATALNYSYTNEDIIKLIPAASLAVPVATPPEALSLSGVVPRTYGLEHRIEIQTPVPMPIPGATTPPKSGQPSLWTFPEDLIQRAKAGVLTPYEILTTNHEGLAGRHAKAVTNATWGCLIPFRIRQVDASLKLFDLLGVDYANRDLLLSLREWLPTDTSGKTAAFTLLPPAPNAGNAEGLAVQTGSSQDIYLIKTNLSTETVPQPPAAVARTEKDGSPSLYFASLSELENFLTLLWEGSLVGGTGYYFGSENDLPASTFDDKGNATVQILVIAGTQQSGSQEGRELLPFNTCALAGPGLDKGLHTLFVESYDDSDMISQAVVPPGCAGFSLKTNYPAEVTDPDEKKEVMLRTLYSLLDFSIPVKSGSPFTALPAKTPIPPTPKDEQTIPKGLKERMLRRKLLADDRNSMDPKPYWGYEQVLPMYNFAPESSLPNVQGLPNWADDPYRGFGNATTIPEATFQLGFGDVFGNRTAAPPSGEGTIPVKVGYTDPLIGVMEWPAIACYYDVEKVSEEGALFVSIGLRPAAVLPSPSQPGAMAAGKADEQAVKYSQSYYQLGQNISGRLVTTLKDADDLNIDVSSLWRFAAGAYAFSATASQLESTFAPDGKTLEEIISGYNVRYTEMALANAECCMKDIFAEEPLRVPAFAVFAEHDRAASIAAVTRPQGWPAPTAEDILKDPENGELPLRVGALLQISPARLLSTGDTPPDLAVFASQNGTTPALLATENATVAALQEGFVFSVEIEDNLYVEVTVTSSSVENPIDTFQKVADTFAAEGVNVTPANLAELHADKEGLFAPNQTLSSSVWVAKEGESLSENGSGLTQAQLAPLNVHTPDIFDSGALVCLGDFNGTEGVRPDPLQTLRQFADSYACPIALLLEANASKPLVEGNRFVIPGLSAWPADTATLRVPYTIAGTDSLNEIAARFQPAENGLAEANADMPRTLMGNITINVTVGSQTVPVTTDPGGESFASALAKVQLSAPAATMADLASSIGDSSGTLQPYSLLLCPPCKLPRACAPNDIASLYTADASLFALANTGIPGLIVPGLTLYSPDGTVSVDTKTGDTFNTLIVRFAEKNVTTDAAGIVSASKNPATPLFNTGALALLPPATIRPGANLGKKGGPYPGPVFPLSVVVRLERPGDLIHPDFNPGRYGTVERVDSAIAAPAKDPGSAGEISLTFDDFIKRMKDVFPKLSVATGKTGTSSQDLWCVDFGPGGIENVTVHGGTTVPGEANPQPRFFALKPLYSILVTRSNVPIKDLTNNGELSPAATFTDFQGIDAELWAARFLADMDRFLSPSFSAALYSDSTMRPSLQSVLESKAALTTNISNDLGAIFDISDSKVQEGMQKAKEALKQQLGVGLLKAYNTSTIVQFDREVVSPWQQENLPLAALYGQLNPSGIQSVLGNVPPSRSWCMTAAKTWLDNSNPFATFLMTVADPVSHKNITATLEYDFSHIEFNISSDGLPDGYVSSDWLNFVPVLAGADRPAAIQTDLGEVTIPVALRNFPPLPIILDQTAKTSSESDKRKLRMEAELRSLSGVVIGQTPLWNYGFTYSHQHAEQDDVNIIVEFNLGRGPGALLEEDQRDVFTELAKYIAVADKLWSLLGSLDEPGDPQIAHGEASNAVLKNAVETFTVLAEDITSYWSRRLISAAASVPDDLKPGTAFCFGARVTDRDSASLGREIDYLTLTQEGDSPGPEEVWPVIYVKKADGTRQLLTQDHVSDKKMEYLVPADLSISINWPVFTLEWQNLNVSQWQNATGKVYVERNNRLLGDSGPETNREFLFKTELVAAQTAVTPLNVWSERIQITGTPGDDYVKTALNNAFNALFPQAMISGEPQLKVTIGISYAYELAVDPADPAHSLVSEVPVALYTDKILDGNTAGILQNAVNTWKTKNNPDATGGEWVFSLTLYSSMEEEKRPLLVIERMFCELTK